MNTQDTQKLTWGDIDAAYEHKDRPDSGVYLARVLDVVMLGEHLEERFQPAKVRDTVRVRFKLEPDENGHSFTASTKVNLSFHPMSKLVPMIKAIFPDTPPATLDDLIGEYCMVNVEHSPNGYHFVENVMPVRKGHTEFDLPAKHVRQCFRTWYENEAEDKGPQDIRNQRSNRHDAQLAEQYATMRGLMQRAQDLIAKNKVLAAGSGDRPASAPKRSQATATASQPTQVPINDDLPF